MSIDWTKPEDYKMSNGHEILNFYKDANFGYLIVARDGCGELHTYWASIKGFIDHDDELAIIPKQKRFRARKDFSYKLINALCEAAIDKDNGGCIDKKCYELGNYFHPDDPRAEQCAADVREVFRRYRDGEK